jgi:hypothetical protein
LLKGAANLNPGGRPKGLALQIREKTDNLKAQVAFMIDLSEGKIKGATTRDRIEAVKWLADRGHGKAVETSVQVEADKATADAALSVSEVELEQVARSLAVVSEVNPGSPDASAGESKSPVAA